VDRIDVMLEPLRALLIQVGAFLPRLAIALLVLVAGLVLAKAARFALQKALRAVNVHVLTQRAGLDELLQQGGTRLDTVGLIGLLTWWAIVLAALIVAFNGLGLTHVTELLSRALLFLPRLALALLILTLGAYFARFLSNAIVSHCRASSVRDGELLGRLARWAVLGFVVILALDQIEVGGSLIHDAFLLVLGGVMLAVAIAFGLGGRHWATAHLERWWPAPRDRDPP
jgi:Conserved TM helix